MWTNERTLGGDFECESVECLLFLIVSILYEWTRSLVVQENVFIFFSFYFSILNTFFGFYVSWNMNVHYVKYTVLKCNRDECKMKACCQTKLKKKKKICNLCPGIVLFCCSWQLDLQTFCVWRAQSILSLLCFHMLSIYWKQDTQGRGTDSICAKTPTRKKGWGGGG